MKFNLMFLVLFVFSVLNGQNFELDKSFGGNGVVKENYGIDEGFQIAYDVKNFIDDSYLVMGISFEEDDDEKIILSKYLNSGILDTSFADNGSYYEFGYEDGAITTFVVLPSNKIALHSQDEEFAVLIILNEDGSLYKREKYKVSEGENITTKIIANDKYIYISGFYNSFTPSDSLKPDSSFVIRLDMEGTIDKTFGKDGIITFGSEDKLFNIVNIVFQGDNIIYAYATRNNEIQETTFISRLTESGEIDSGFAENGRFKISKFDGFYIDLHVNNKKEIFLKIQGEPAVIKLDEDGNVDNSYGINGSSDSEQYKNTEFNSAFGLIDHNDGGFMFFGGTSEYADESQPMIIKITDKGFPDSSFADNSVILDNFGGFSSFVNGVYDSMGRLVVVGYNTDEGEFSNFLIVRYKTHVNSIEPIKALPQKFSLFPNPAKKYIHIKFERDFTGEIKIIDITGKTLYQQKADAIISKSIAVNKLKPGAYLLRLTTKKMTTTKKFIVTE